MGTIRILPSEVSNRIAAGEVIERPASVVKELTENAIDAGASRIRVQTADGGRRLIQVTDDGCGMDRQDALLCIEAHATSKIRETADVGQIRTLGFRGEALPSISAVSRFVLQTRPHDDHVGTEVLLEAGTLKDVRDCGCAAGTNVRVSHLFATMPARRKFMRGANTEDGHIQEVILLQALAHPDISFDYQANGRSVIRASKTESMGDRLGMLLGRDVLEQMLEVNYEESGIRVTGFVARPGFTRSNRREQRVFVNGRPASAEVVYFGIKDAYHTLVMKGRYPPVALFIDLAPERVDVNVHPAKREVRFREAHLAGQVVSAAVSRALRGMVTLPREPEATDDAGSVAPAARPFRLSAGPHQPHLPVTDLPDRPSVPDDTPSPSAADPSRQAETEVTAPAHDPGSESPDGSAVGPANGAILPTQRDAGAPPPAAGAPPPAGSPPPSAADQGMAGATTSARHDIASLRLLGLFSGEYIVAEGPRGLVLIDHVAAHQRILFEQLLRNVARSDVLRQQLLLPATVELGPEDARRLQAFLDEFIKIGFSIDHFGGNTFLISAVPSRFPCESLASLLRDILDDLQERGRIGPGTDDVRIAKAACRHAVRPSDTLTREEMTGLLRELSRTEMPYTCPNGRPVMVSISAAELARKFGRRE